MRRATINRIKAPPPDAAAVHSDLSVVRPNPTGRESSGPPTRALLYQVEQRGGLHLPSKHAKGKQPPRAKK